jgi:thiamine monophosphate kinase
MTAPRQQRKAQMAAAASSRTEPDARPRSTAIRSKPVRITLDLSPGLYRELTRWADSAAVTLDVPRVALADVLRAMIRVTAESPDTSGEVTAQLRRDREH